MSITRRRTQRAATSGSLRDLQTFRAAGLRVFSAPKQSPRPPQRQYPGKVRRGLRKPLGGESDGYEMLILIFKLDEEIKS